MRDKKELTAEDFYKKDNPDNTYEESPIDQWYFGKEDMILFAKRFHQAKLREKAMWELTSQSVEDGERVYTEAQVKERAWWAWMFSVDVKGLSDFELKNYRQTFENYYEAEYESDE